MRIIVCGGRKYKNWESIAHVLGGLLTEFGSFTLVHGDCTGADGLAKHWALLSGVEHEPHPADWTTHGKAAGPIRNREMLAAGADLVVAFPGHNGTADMVRIAERAGVRVRKIS